MRLQHAWRMMHSMGKPELKPDPFPEPEKPWLIDPRPAIREAKEAWADLRKVPRWRWPWQAPRKPIWYWAIYAIALVLLIAAMYYLRDQTGAPLNSSAIITEGHR